MPHPRAAAGLSIAALLLTSTSARAEPPDRSAAPYFQVLGDDATARLPLRATHAEVDIAGVIARVHVTQVYENTGPTPIEAIYVFPGSTRAAVFAMQMKIGERTVKAQIERKDEARRLYEAAKQQGKSASLLEQHRPNVFQMNVANIMPGDTIEVSLDYTELLVPEAGTYELVYPTVVGPRYVAAAAGGAAEAWTGNPYLPEGGAPTHRWGLKVRLEAGVPIQAVTSPSHRIAPRYTGKTSLEVVSDDEQGGNRDFVLRYQLAGRTIETGLLLFPGEEESFFLLMMQPPERPAPAIIPPREYVFIVDISGSMHGFPLETTKALMRSLLGQLRSGDRFNLLLFSGSSQVLADESLPATPEHLERAIALLARQRGGGSTELVPALRRALALPRSPQLSTNLVVITDGYVSVEREAFSLIRAHLGTANLFAFGIGSAVNRALIEGMARAGMGEPFVVLKPQEAAEKAAAFQRYIEAPVLTGVRVHYEGFGAYDVEPAAVPDVFAERPVIVFGKYRGAAKGNIRVEGKTGQGRFAQTLAVSPERAKASNAALRHLWARHRIGTLEDQATVFRDASVTEAITTLGLRYGLMTQHTSFVAIDSLVRNHVGHSDTVTQPLPLPEGVSGLAVAPAQAMFSTPPPSGGLGTRGPVPARRLSRPSSQRDALSSPEAARDEPAPVPLEPATSKPRDPASSAARTLVRAKAQLLACHEMAPGAALPERVELELELGSTGKVRSVKLLKSTGDLTLDRCLLERVKRLRFEAPGAATTLRVPLALR